MNTEERQLAEMLHRVTPEPPRGVSVQDVASRVAGQAGPGRQAEPRLRRGPRPWRRRRLAWGRGWVPALAALSVFAVAGTSAAIATVVTSRHGPASPATGATSARPAPMSSAPSSTPSAVAPPLVAGGIWGAALINRQSFAQDSLAGGADSLYAATGGALVRIDHGGTIVRSTPYQPPLPNRPVILGNTVWVVWSYRGGNVVLHGYDSRTLAQVASVPVPAIGGVSSTAHGVLAGGPGGHLYLAAGDTVAVVDPAAGQVTTRLYLPADRAGSVAVSPDGSTLYVGTDSSGSFRLLTLDLATGRERGSSRMPAEGAGNLIATSGGVWGTAASGTSEWVWFAPGGDLARSFRVGQGAGGGVDSVPSVSGGAVWIGGPHALACANPDTGRVRASTAIPADRGAVRYVGSVTVLSGGRTYALYQDQAAQVSGLVALITPPAC